MAGLQSRVGRSGPITEGSQISTERPLSDVSRGLGHVGYGAAPAAATWKVSGGNLSETGHSGLAYAEPPEPPTTPGGKSLQRWSLSPARPSVWSGTKKWGIVVRANGRPVLRVGARPMRVASQSSTNLYPPP